MKIRRKLRSTSQRTNSHFRSCWRTISVEDSYLSVVFIPQTWFLDTKGTLQWIHEGYGGDAQWQQMMTTKLDEVLRAQPLDAAGVPVE